MLAKNMIALGAVLAALAVVLGAFGAHAIDFVSEKAKGTYELGVTYQYYHSFAILLTGILQYILKDTQKLLSYATLSFFVGILLFSGSLYLIANREALGIEDYSFIYGPMTPIGGLFFILAWVLLLIQALKLPRN